MSSHQANTYRSVVARTQQGGTDLDVASGSGKRIVRNMQQNPLVQQTVTIFVVDQTNITLFTFTTNNVTSFAIVHMPSSETLLIKCEQRSLPALHYGDCDGLINVL